MCQKGKFTPSRGFQSGRGFDRLPPILFRGDIHRMRCPLQIYLPIAEVSVNAFLLLGLGGLVGILSGMFGVGGGFLMTPLLFMIGIPPAVAVATEALRAELEAQTREAAAKYAGALEEETAERKSGDASVGGKIADAVGAVAEELRRSVLELAADLTTESETLRAHCEAHAEQAVAALQNTVTEGLGLNAEALEELRGDVAAAVEKAEGMEAAAAGGAGGEEDAKSVHSDISEAKEKLGEMQREIEAVKAHAEQQVAELLAKSQEDLKAEMSKGNEATAAMLEKIMAKLSAE